MKNTKHTPLRTKDVVRILHPQCKEETGVISRIDFESNMALVFRTKRNNFATWFFIKNLKRIGRVS